MSESYLVCQVSFTLSILGPLAVHVKRMLIVSDPEGTEKSNERFSHVKLDGFVTVSNTTQSEPTLYSTLSPDDLYV